MKRSRGFLQVGGIRKNARPLVFVGRNGMRRPSITVDEQISLMKNHGIRFECCDEANARDFLENRTYFFKLKAFENNFTKSDGRYLNLDFDYLKDLSIIDYHLRELLNFLSLNIEHSIKTRFNKLIMNDLTEDGYSIVALLDPEGKYQFSDFGPDSKYKKSVYTEGLIRKYCPDPAIWHLWETFSFYELVNAYEAYLKNRHIDDKACNLLNSVRFLRNASSHSNCLLIGIGKNINPTIYMKNCLKELTRLLGLKDTPLYDPLREYPLVHDFASTLFAFLIFVDSPGIRNDAFARLGLFSARIWEKHDYRTLPPNTCPHLVRTLGTLQTLADMVCQYMSLKQHDFHKDKLLHCQPRPFNGSDIAGIAQMRAMAGAPIQSAGDK